MAARATEAVPGHAWLRGCFRDLAREEAPRDGAENPVLPAPPKG